MRKSPPLAPGAPHHATTVHIVLDDFGKLGRAYRETDEAEADEATIIENMLRGEYSQPVRVVAFNSAEQLSRDVSEDIARAVADRVRNEGWQLNEGTRRFVEDHLDDADLPTKIPPQGRRG
jgi:hypothetical protein